MPFSWPGFVIFYDIIKTNFIRKLFYTKNVIHTFFYSRNLLDTNFSVDITVILFFFL